jgi:hypothetical protein
LGGDGRPGRRRRELRGVRRILLGGRSGLRDVSGGEFVLGDSLLKLLLLFLGLSSSSLSSSPSPVPTSALIPLLIVLLGSLLLLELRRLVGCWFNRAQLICVLRFIGSPCSVACIVGRSESLHDLLWFLFIASILGENTHLDHCLIDRGHFGQDDHDCEFLRDLKTIV